MNIDIAVPIALAIKKKVENLSESE